MSLQNVELVRRAMEASEFDRDIEGMKDAGNSQVVVFFRPKGTARASGIPWTSV